MEAVQQGAERHIGPYQVLHEWSGQDGAGQHADADIRYALARDAHSGRVHTLMLPAHRSADDRAYGVRFRAEAENSRRLTGPWLAPVAAVAPQGTERPWVAYDCFPALPLPAALAACGGPLPAATVRALGAVLAETLARAHAQGMVHGGISRASVLITPYGPRLTGYGLVRAAALDGTDRTGVPGIDAATLPPEQRTGGRPRPLGDVFALGAVLAYAATGRTVLDPAALPDELRDLLTACSAQDPEQRPVPAVLARELAFGGPAPGADALPPALLGALEDQRTAHPADIGGALHATRPAEGPRAASGASHPRRALVTALAGGAAGLALGMGGVAAARAAGVGRPTPRRPLLTRGSAPAPLWRYELEVSDPEPQFVWRGKVAAFDAAGLRVAVDLRTGKKLWSRDDLYGTSMPLEDGSMVMGGLDELTFSSIRTGRILRSERGYDGVKEPSLGEIIASRGRTLWFGGSTDDNDMVIAYDVTGHKELWRTPIPRKFVTQLSIAPTDGAGAAVTTEDALLLPGSGSATDESPMAFLALDRRSGKRLWTREVDGWPVNDTAVPYVVDPGNRVAFALGDGVHAVDLSSGEHLWKHQGDSRIPYALVRHGNTLFAADFHGGAQAIDMRSGKLIWRRRRSKSSRFESIDVGTAVSHSGRMFLQSNGSEIDALDAADGALRWRLTLSGRGNEAAGAGSFLGSAPGAVFVLHTNALYALPVD
ncbi:PQQ-binding-like beta-propeller repeat protein [Streptomyces sp. NPDC000151]|uniref:outer membrane protein assembly factor BamB family protein n=1 Tax=Streptomyces sp. NPDC000151 TaxID=3154244 RepID=UPI00332796D4